MFGEGVTEKEAFNQRWEGVTSLDGREAWQAQGTAGAQVLRGGAEEAKRGAQGWSSWPALHCAPRGSYVSAFSVLDGAAKISRNYCFPSVFCGLIGQMSRNQISGSKGLPILTVGSHFLKPSLIACFFFPFPTSVHFAFRPTFIFPHIVYLLLLECSETSVATAWPREKAQLCGLAFKASSVCSQPTPPTFSPLLPCTVYSLLQRTWPSVCLFLEKRKARN